MNKKISILVIVLALLVGGYLFFSGGYQTQQKSGTQTSTLEVPAPGFESVSETAVIINENSIEIDNQLQGNSVTVLMVQFVESGYIVIHKDTNGKPGPVIGNSKILEKGTNTNIVITLTGESKIGETLYAMLHKDDGDGVYEFPGDDVPLENESGKVVLSKFSIVENIVKTIPSVKEINMVSGNLFFTPRNLTLIKDQPVKITFKNNGSHTFTIDELGVNITLRGGSGIVEFTPTKSGTFEYYCSVPGHREGGMLGSLLVK